VFVIERGTTGLCKSLRCMARHGQARKGEARLGSARLVMASQGKARIMRNYREVIHLARRVVARRCETSRGETRRVVAGQG